MLSYLTASGIGSSFCVGLASTLIYSATAYFAGSCLTDFPPWMGFGSDLPTGFFGAGAGEGRTGFFSTPFFAGPGLFRPWAEIFWSFSLLWWDFLSSPFSYFSCSASFVLLAPPFLSWTLLLFWRADVLGLVPTAVLGLGFTLLGSLLSRCWFVYLCLRLERGPIYYLYLVFLLPPCRSPRPQLSPLPSLGPDAHSALPMALLHVDRLTFCCL